MEQIESNVPPGAGEEFNSSLLKEEVENTNSDAAEDNTAKWTSETTKLLLDEYMKRREKFRDPLQKKVLLWREIEKIFQEKGYMFTYNQLDTKFRNLKKTFITISENNSKKKTGQGAVSWPFFEKLLEIFQEDRSINLNSKLIQQSTANTSDKYVGSWEEDCPSMQCTSTAALPTIETLYSEASCEDEVEGTAVVERRPAPGPARWQRLTATEKKSARYKKLDRQRQEQLELERERLDELKSLVQAVHTSNEIMLERNNILKDLVQKLG